MRPKPKTNSRPKAQVPKNELNWMRGFKSPTSMPSNLYFKAFNYFDYSPTLIMAWAQLYLIYS